MIKSWLRASQWLLSSCLKDEFVQDLVRDHRSLRQRSEKMAQTFGQRARLKKRQCWRSVCIREADCFLHRWPAAESSVMCRDGFPSDPSYTGGTTEAGSPSTEVPLGQGDATLAIDSNYGPGLKKLTQTKRIDCDDRKGGA